MIITVLKPSVDMLCDPDYINQKLINYIDYRRQLSEDTRKKYTYAATYEQFVKLIDKCEDLEALKQIRWLTKKNHQLIFFKWKKTGNLIIFAFSIWSKLYFWIFTWELCNTDSAETEYFICQL